MKSLGQLVTDPDSYIGRRMHKGAMELAKEYFDSGAPFVFYEDGELLVTQECLTQYPQIGAIVRNATYLSPVKLSTGSTATVHACYSDALRNATNPHGANTGDSVAQEEFKSVISEAIRFGSSDVHIFLRKPVSMISFRVDGDVSLESAKPLSYDRVFRMLSTAYNWNGANNTTEGFSARSLLPGSFEMDVIHPMTQEMVRVSLRLENAPEHVLLHSKCVIRVSLATRVRNLEELRIPAAVIDVAKTFMARPNGMILVSGPTGSGKTTFLHGAVHYLPKGKTMSSIEDPVELIADHNPLITQSNLLPGMSYDVQLRSLMRQDPNCIMIGEMRDNETARIAYRAVLTGHLILSTVHTSDSPGIIKRLNDFGLSYSDMAQRNALSLLVACRLLKILCPTCKRQITSQYPYAKAVEKRLGSIAGVFQPNPHGCGKCRNGYLGRESVIEYIVVTETFRNFIEKADIDGGVRYLKEHGWKSLQDHGWDMIQAGLVDPLDAEKELTDVVIDTGEDFNYSHQNQKSWNNSPAERSIALVPKAAEVE
jgi:type II secretory ATPase GspE/PulE/Tfp pilus assembly ATPase PilB-like protein